MVREAVRRPVHHPYSDRPDDGIEVSTYSFEELYAEKLRALAERLRPRDLYDVIHLYRRQELNPDRSIVIEILREKCAFKGIAVPTVESIRVSPLVAELRAGWEQMLRHQLPQLPPFEDSWLELPQMFAWLFVGEARIELPVLEVASAGALDRAWRAPRMATSWRSFGTSHRSRSCVSQRRIDYASSWSIRTRAAAGRSNDRAASLRRSVPETCSCLR
jgi:hypothetical protein